jgi:hypothetical protein
VDELTMTLLAALALCLSIDGIDLPPVTLTEPPVVEIRASETRISLGAWDRRTLARELRERGFDAGQIAAALAPMRLSDPGTEALKCGTCQIMHSVTMTLPTSGRTFTDCGNYPDGPLCIKCGACKQPSGEPVAECGAPPRGGKEGR